NSVTPFVELSVYVVSSFSFFFSSRRRHTRFSRDWSSDVCSSDLEKLYLSTRRTPQEQTFCRGDWRVYEEIWLEIHERIIIKSNMGAKAPRSLRQYPHPLAKAERQ